jgi:RimJ/RimL family protein N-acetyltransferase
MTDAPIVTITGQRVLLGPLLREHLPALLRWLHAAEFQRTTSQTRPLTLEALEQHFERGARASDEVHLAIYDRTSGALIGSVNLTQITARTATFAIGIGEPAYRGHGYGTEITRLMLDYAFNVLGVHNVMLTVHADNAAGLRAYARAGFREIGRRREVLERGGHLVDVVYMDCVATDFSETPSLG